MIIIPKLTSTVAAKVDEAESGDFEALPEGIYGAVLDGEVEAVDGPKGMYWKWVFKLTDEGYNGRKVFHRTSLSEAAMWKLKETFTAFGVAADTDTDDLIGKPVKLMIVQEIIQSGSRKGDMGNTIKTVLPVAESAADPADKKQPARKGAAADDGLLF